MTDKTKEVLRLALRALEYIDLTDNDRDFLQPHECYMLDEAITAIRSALALVNKVDQEESSGIEQPAIKQDLTPEQPAQPQQEPVACVIDGDLYFHHEIDWEDLANQGYGVELLYTSPPASKPWVGLTDEEVKHEWVVWRASIPRYMGFAKGIEAKLKAKNSP